MNYQYLTEKDFKNFSSYMPATVALATMVLTIILIEITHTRFLGAFVVLTPLLAGRFVLHLEYKKWRKEMIRTGHITSFDFDNLTEKYNISARQWLTKKELYPMLTMTSVILAISIYFFREDLELKTYGKETIGTVYKINNFYLKSAALIEFNIEGQQYFTSTMLQVGDNFSFKEPIYRSKNHVPAKVGQQFRILYSTRNPKVNRLMDDIPIKK